MGNGHQVPLFLMLCLAASCASPAGPDPVGRLVARTDCKDSGGASTAAAAADPASNRECVQYDYDGTGRLRLRHVNAAFNCCPGTISADIDIAGGTIRIVESESSSLCDCSCLYDLTYEIALLPPGRYRIAVLGPYQIEEEPPLVFDVDLGRAVTGVFCVERAHYPWGY